MMLCDSLEESFQLVNKYFSHVYRKTANTSHIDVLNLFFHWYNVIQFKKFKFNADHLLHNVDRKNDKAENDVCESSKGTALKVTGCDRRRFTFYLHLWRRHDIVVGRSVWASLWNRPMNIIWAFSRQGTTPPLPTLTDAKMKASQETSTLCQKPSNPDNK